MFPWDQPKNPYQVRIEKAISKEQKLNKSQQTLLEKKTRNQYNRDVQLRSQNKYLFTSDDSKNYNNTNTKQASNFEGDDIMNNKSDILNNRGRNNKSQNRVRFQLQSWKEPTTLFNEQSEGQGNALKVTPSQSNLKEVTQKGNNRDLEASSSNQYLNLPSLSQVKNRQLEQQVYANELLSQIKRTEQLKKEVKNVETQEAQRRLDYQALHDPFGKDHLKQISYVTTQLARPQTFIEDFLTAQNPDPQKQQFVRQRGNVQIVPQDEVQQQDQQLVERLTTQQESKTYSRNIGDQEDLIGSNQILNQQSHDHNLQYDRGREDKQRKDYERKQILQSRQFQRNTQNNHLDSQYGQNSQIEQVLIDSNQQDIANNQSEFISTYDQQFSHNQKTERSKLVKQLNQINEDYLKQLMSQIQIDKTNLGNNIYPKEVVNDQLLHYQEQYHQPFNHNDQPIQTRKDEEVDKLLQEALYREQQLKEQIEIQKRNLALQTQQQPVQNEVETQTFNQSDLMYESYLDSLKNLSNQVVDMKNDYINEQIRLNYNLNNLKKSAQDDLEAKMLLTKELKSLEDRQRAMKIWEGERQRQLMQAIAKNQTQKYIEQPLNYKALNPNLQRVVHFKVKYQFIVIIIKDKTMGYEYEQDPNIYSKSNLIPLNQIIPQQNQYGDQLNERVNLNFKDYDKIIVDNTSQLRYTTPHTKAIMMNDISKDYYNYSQNTQWSENRLPQQGSDYIRDIRDCEVENILLENDKRLYQLDQLNKDEDYQDIQKLYDYKLI